MNRILNKGVLLQSFVGFSFSMTLMYLILTDEVLYYVTPGHKKWLWFLALASLLFSGLSLKNLFSLRRHNIHARLLVLILPMLLILIPHDKTSVHQHVKNVIQPAPIQQTIYEPAALMGEDSKNKVITIEDREFYLWLKVLFSAPEKYDGYTIKTRGAVFTNAPLLEANQFYISRQLMTCCINDLVTVGFLAEKSDETSFSAGDWVYVEGVIHWDPIGKQNIPTLTVEKIQSTTAPKQIYLFQR